MKCVRDIMSTPPVTITEDKTAYEAAGLMCKHDIGCLVVQNAKEDIVGIVTERDMLFKITAEGKDSKIIKVKDIMTRELIRATPDLSIYEASTMLEDKKIRRLPVCKFIAAMHKDRLMGLVTETDIHIAMRDHTIEDLKTKMHELEIFNKMAIGRELKMAELKKKVQYMEKKTGKKPKP